MEASREGKHVIASQSAEHALNSEHPVDAIWKDTEELVLKSGRNAVDTISMAQTAFQLIAAVILNSYDSFPL